ncbi:unnamed protein product [Toxocara canis]|uniref:MADF domain-containing protein n=1 Tax=Toxocara canis TaxID=6265 RepID=A0A183V9S1_TOXCA|nr:unnamed protein product [Toxocara canis]
MAGAGQARCSEAASGSSSRRSPSDLNPPGEPSFNEVLINTVRDYPALYSTTRRPYDGVDRQIIWKEVAERIGRKVSPEFAKKRWLQLRDRYRKELKIAIAHNFSQPQKWNHFALLKWLDPHLQGSVPIAAAEHSSFESNNSLSCLDGLIKSQTSYTEYAANLAAQAQNDKMEAADSDLLDDVKPMLSTLQSVLAATEVKLANEKTSKDCIENVFAVESSTPSVAEATCGSSASVSSIQEVSPPSDASQISLSDRASLIDILSSRESDQPNALHAGREITKREVEQPHECAVMNSTAPAAINGCNASIVDIIPPTCSPTIAAYKSQSALYSNAFRFRARNLNNKYRPTAVNKTCAPPSLSRPIVGGDSGSGSTTDDWINDEEMLFARIVGLRLKKMDTCRRKLVGYF